VIEPGKRPRITLTPTLVLKDGKPVLAVSVAGGDLQDQVTLQLLLNHLEFTNHHLGSFGQKPPALGSLEINGEAGEPVLADLEGRGHLLKRRAGALAAPCVIEIDPASRRFHAAGDPKAGRHALAY
jgi:gamma-glutamyltranspeptidase/glutathione hydrolase